MSGLSKVAERLKEDFNHSGKLGEKSQRRLIDLVEAMACAIERLEERVAKPERK